MRVLLQSVLRIFRPIIQSSVRPHEVRFHELSKGLRKGTLTLIDCRNQTEREDPGMIPGSFNIPLHEAQEAFKLTESEFEARYRFKKPDPSNDQVVVACRSGKRAEDFIDRIRPLGYENFRLYKGSFLDWEEKGGPVTREKLRGPQ
ncbi:unnamed protein product [Notodromas monacha]|uniref:Rhodanese domain-containing protein n=1 Tax=Notodromas monacha TaxID=399045 RepID=A0A7R9BW36_9CRUS|nr:unnamed protein product [Notodromas monacha]CAD7282722.1 unnamed protein product [Notodromas monacha]CAG0915910.1 unnamed protein product [Notodromas monacha]CAG0922874.1 unnamed protein product [Notodromas monacha]